MHVEIAAHVLPPDQGRKPSDRGLFHFAGVVPELGGDEVQPRIGVDVLSRAHSRGARVARPHRRHVGRRAGGDMERGSVFVWRGDTDVDFRLLIAQQYPAAGLEEGALDHRDGADPFQRRRRIGRGAHDHDRVDQRFETADVSGRDEGLDLGARGGDQRDEVFGEVDGPSERVPRTLRRQQSLPPAAGSS